LTKNLLFTRSRTPSSLVIFFLLSLSLSLSLSLFQDYPLIHVFPSIARAPPIPTAAGLLSQCRSQVTLQASSPQFPFGQTSFLPCAAATRSSHCSASCSWPRRGRRIGIEGRRVRGNLRASHVDAGEVGSSRAAMVECGGASLQDEEGSDYKEELGTATHIRMTAVVPRAVRWLAGEGAASEKVAGTGGGPAHGVGCFCRSRPCRDGSVLENECVSAVRQRLLVIARAMPRPIRKSCWRTRDKITSSSHTWKRKEATRGDKTTRSSAALYPCLSCLLPRPTALPYLPASSCMCFQVIAQIPSRHAACSAPAPPRSSRGSLAPWHQQLLSRCAARSSLELAAPAIPPSSRIPSTISSWRCRSLLPASSRVARSQV
jgi:hypothetical protein